MYMVVALVALCGLVSLAVDFGRVQLAKAELQTTADAAARAAAAGLMVSADQARYEAAAIARANTCDGTRVELDKMADVEFGQWDKQRKVFTAVGGFEEDGATAVRVTARRLGSRKTAIPLTFARVVGAEECDVSASAVATVFRGNIVGFVGLEGVRAGEGSVFASYDSSRTKHPEQGLGGDGGCVASNGAIIGSSSQIRGNVVLGDLGSVSGCVVSGNVDRISGAIPAPAMAAWSPKANPGGIARQYVVNGEATLPGGTYYLRSLTIRGELSFSGAATVYVNGNVRIDGGMVAWNRVPSNLKIRQIGAGRSFRDASGTDMELVAEVEAPGSDFVANGKLLFLGCGTFRTMTIGKGGMLYRDEAGGGRMGKPVIALVN